MNIILITGASSGIGEEFAKQIDNHFSSIDELWLIGRNEEKLLGVSATMKHPCRCFSMDITNQQNIDRLAELLMKKNAVIRILINCAGFGLMGPFEKQPLDGSLSMIETNCSALTAMTYKMIPFMKRNSRIIQLASSAGFLPQQDFAVYAASKSYVLSFSRALRMELLPKEIYVTAVCPGPVDTPFFDIAEKNGSTLAIKKYTMVSAKDVVSLALRDSYHRKSLSVCSLPIKSLRVLCKIVPTDFLLWVCSWMKGNEE